MALTGSSESSHGMWSSRWIFILAATGSAVGLGNIWKFPYVAGQSGGGAFVLTYLACIALIGVPVLMAETLIGRRGRESPINTMRDLAKAESSTTAWMGVGWLGAVCGFLILSFYSVIAGWVLSYLLRFAGGEFAGTNSDAATQTFNSLLADPMTLMGWHSLFMAMTIYFVARGVSKGLEGAIKVMMPALFVLLIAMLGYSMFSGSFMEGARFMFAVDFSKINGEAVLSAMGQAFFTLSLGMGAIMVYGAYMPKSASIGTTAVLIALLDTLVAVAAGLAIFPIVFANGLEPGAGPGLIFVTLPLAFGQMGMAGQVFGTLFFLLVTFAALSSSISLMEPFVAWLVEKLQVSRVVCALGLGFCIWLVGMGTVLSFNEWSDVPFLMGKSFFDSLDYLTSNIMLPLGGLLIALFAGWVMSRESTADELSMNNALFYNVWLFLLRFVAPAGILLVFVYGLGIL